MTFPVGHRRSISQLARVGAIGLAVAAGLMGMSDARAEPAGEAGQPSEPAHARTESSAADRLSRSPTARSSSKPDHAAADSGSRTGVLPPTPPPDGRTQPKANAAESDDRRTARLGGLTSPCPRDAPSGQRTSKARAKPRDDGGRLDATAKRPTDPPCAPTVGTRPLPSEPARTPRAAIENSEAAHSSAASAAIESLAFENGEVPHARAALERIKKDFAKCAVSEPGPADGTVEFRFIVRAPGKAEGVDVARVHGVSANIVRCATSALTLRSVGAPSADPVGVILTVRFGNS